MQLNNKSSYMEYWHFSKEEKQELIEKLTLELPALRGAVNASQSDIANVIGVSRQTYSAIESHKRFMSWNTYMSLILFFDYNPNSHNRIRQLGVFPYKLDECWLVGKMKAMEEADGRKGD